ncbi:MAG: hypothetical protein ACJAQ4_001276 [Cryomorphaceae bacterium]|jgi:hypothetical protein
MSPLLLRGQREDKRAINYIYRNSFHLVRQETRSPDRDNENRR